MSRLNKKEINYIDKHKDDLTAELISLKLNRGISTVRKHIKKLREKEAVIEEEEFLEEEAKKPRNSEIEFMGTREGRGVVIMTEAASMRADKLREKTSRLPSGRYKNAIMKFDPNKPTK